MVVKTLAVVFSLKYIYKTILNDAYLIKDEKTSIHKENIIDWKCFVAIIIS